jgi:outer membrane protein assembly factor BamA
VAAAPYSDIKLHKITAISFNITAPSVIVGDIHPENAPAALDPKAVEVLAKLSGSPYDREGSASQITTNLANVYRDKGYLEPEIHVTQQSSAVITPEAIRIPFSVSVVAGLLYKVAAIQLAPDMLVTQADFDKQSQVHPGDVADAQHIRENWQFLERQYHNRGYMTARVQPTSTFDRSQGTVSYTVAAQPGPQYTMGALSIENVSDDLRAQMLAVWKLPAGAPFNEGAVRGYFATHDVNPKLERIFALVNCKYVLHLNDASKTVDVVLRLEKRT